MPEIAETILIPAPLAAVWPLLSDPAAVAACIPGATLAPDTGDGVWRGAIKVRFGPTIASFKGEATLAFDHTAHRCTIEGRGIDGRGASRALSHGEVLASAEGEATRLAVTGSFTVTGPLETFANAGGVHVARAILHDFAGNMAALVTARAPAATGDEAPPPIVAAPPRVAAPISGYRLFLRAMFSWLFSLFGKRNPW
jgi:carbon monoxide dehydrogenase subunit G